MTYAVPPALRNLSPARHPAAPSRSAIPRGQAGRRVDDAITIPARHPAATIPARPPVADTPHLETCGSVHVPARAVSGEKVPEK